jgi:hypothetical protein
MRDGIILKIPVVYSSVVDPDPDADPQGSGTFAGTGSVTRGFRIRVHIRKWM